MAIPLTTVLSAAPGIISAAADIIRVIRQKKTEPPLAEQDDSEKLRELESLLEKQALVIEELAKTNKNLALAVRNNRFIAFISICIAVTAIILSVSV